MSECTACSGSPWSCPRCGVGVCSDHMAAYRQECISCALAYYDSLDKVRMNVWFVIGALFPWYLYALIYPSLPSWDARSGGFRAITTGVPALDVLIMFAIVSVFAGKAMITLRKWRHDRTFVSSEPPRAQLVVRD